MSIKALIPCVLLLLGSFALQSQDLPETDTLDAIGIIKRILGMKDRKKPSPISLVPSLSYNPTFGVMGGINASGVFSPDPEPQTKLSNLLVNTFYSTKGALNFQVRHSLFTPGSRYNFLGDIQFARLVLLGYSLDGSKEKYPARFFTFRINERVYRRITNHFYIGAGIALESYWDIRDEKLKPGLNEFTPHYRYSLEKGYAADKYKANGVQLGLQYNSREHPLRAYSGWFAEVLLRSNQTWLGSSRHSLNLMTDFRKYISLSDTKPEHVLAFWHWGSYTLNGSVPFFALPATGQDMYNRSGRAYTIGRYKGPSFFYMETEYRFPITANKFISGVGFFNMQSTSDIDNRNLMKSFKPAAGGGLRFLINKKTRSALCLDYAFGFDGTSGLFFGLNEAF